MMIEDWLTELPLGSVFFHPLVLKKCIPKGGADRPDAFLELAHPAGDSFQFVVEAKNQSTPQALRHAIHQIRAHVSINEHPMVVVPYLSPEALDELEKEQVSGIDLNGNGTIIIPNRIYISKSGNPNQYPDSRPLHNPYTGHSAMVGRMLLIHTNWSSLNLLHEAIRQEGMKLSLSQTSKAVAALASDLVVFKDKNKIRLLDGMRLLDKLGAGWKKPAIGRRQSIRLTSDSNWPAALSQLQLKWAVSGSSSVTHYGTFAQGGPRQVAVTNLKAALEALGGKRESVPHFGDLELLETDEPGFYFQNEVDGKGIRWASRIQTWLELQTGDARQKEAARDIRMQLIKGATP